MTKTWLLLDCHNLCYRAFHAMGDLSHEGVRTGVIFGFMRDIAHLQEIHHTSNFVFCFDLGESFRTNIYKNYKITRRTKHLKAPQEEKDARQELYRQIRLLRTEYLPAMGYANVFASEGIEADDIIASIVVDLPEDEDAIIVSSDEDLFQLLGPGIRIWNAHKGAFFTSQAFRELYGVKPCEWPRVKALAGCVTDDIDGIEGVGEGRACEYLRGDMNKASKTYAKIKAQEEECYKNLEIIKLPYVTTGKFELRPDRPNPEAWIGITEKLGMRSLAHVGPLGEKKWTQMSRR